MTPLGEQASPQGPVAPLHPHIGPDPFAVWWSMRRWRYLGLGLIFVSWAMIPFTGYGDVVVSFETYSIPANSLLAPMWQAHPRSVYWTVLTLLTLKDLTLASAFFLLAGAHLARALAPRYVVMGLLVPAVLAGVLSPLRYGIDGLCTLDFTLSERSLSIAAHAENSRLMSFRAAGVVALGGCAYFWVRLLVAKFLARERTP